ncbi:hypothetical protein AJ78_04428 [Emergomyces pasteurianus Ep9510]|uniref:Box C/D snoRNA protein 1 n=1 Tax=Emergomyces pasteurianus Ep9510 TaxID=1447872 RepID=A0A1J9QGL5_9EURO|nr:hypothetical protein AJ78_04428 [Emergomyces pasteurianus Ep9510]
MSASKELSLSELCTICRINEPKYKCPRCATPTCSLPCSKRHKLWSQCSGVRDPAAYLKRKDLATPVAFDKDFNFLSGIERYVERAERDAENRGIELAREDVDGDGDGGRRQQWRKKTASVKKGEVGLLKGIESAGVRVVRAPKGMSRRKQNMSYWHKKHKCLNWTIEWILADDDQSQMAISKCLESTSVATAFSRTSLSKQNDSELNTPSPPAKKRKRGSEIIPPPPLSTTHNTNANKPIHAFPSPENQAATPHSQTPLPHTLSPEPRPTPNPAQNPGANTEISRAPENETVPTTISIPKGNCITTNTNTNSGIELPQHKKYHIYLHRPQSRCRVPVLIPLTDSVTITEALRGRTVLEFPTFYVLPCAAGELPGDKFVLEETYLKEHGDDEEDRLKGTEKEEEEEEEAERQEGGNVLRGVDEREVLEVLCKDLEVAC